MAGLHNEKKSPMISFVRLLCFANRLSEDNVHLCLKNHQTWLSVFVAY